MNKENKGMMPLVIGALVLLVLGGIGYSMVKGQKDTAMNKEKVNAETVSNDASMDNKEEGVMVGGALMTPDKDIVANAMNAKNVTTVVAAVKAAGLVETLQGQGPFTVFAPTNSAFEKLPTGTVETLLKPENKQKLSGILTYHVVAGRYTAKDLTDGMVLKTV
ncbi:MAG TPA: fasciclin domain-containing protein, partial [Candidatus Nitrosocosmicus sp.]|nr:fasciclin domain-containing protein [Candidatus Nitrosocosmicus sp.]